MLADKKHIVLLTTWFPPQSGVAVNRMQAFAKYLDHDKYVVTVITLRTGKSLQEEKINGTKVYRVEDMSLFKPIREKAGEMKLVHNLKVLWNVMLHRLKPLQYNNWIRGAHALVEKVHQENKVDVLISSFSPVEPHLAALGLCEKYPEIKWIADMRDEMSMNPHLPRRMIRSLAKTESRIADRADAITSVSQPILSEFRALMPGIRYFEEIRNGYDHEVPPQNNFNEVFTIAYAGSFYGKRKPQTFFEALTRFVNGNNCKIHLRFIGVHRNFSIPALLEKECEFIPHLSNTDAIRQMATADANLLVLPPVPNRGAYSGKIFDYISVMKPVIAVVDSSDVAAALIREMNAGFIADFHDIGGIEKAISSAYQLWSEKKTMAMDPEKVKSLHRKYQVARLGILTEKLLSE